MDFYEVNFVNFSLERGETFSVSVGGYGGGVGVSFVFSGVIRVYRVVVTCGVVVRFFIYFFG